MPLLADIYSRSDAFKRKLVDALRNPRDAAAQMWGDVNDRARVLNEMTSAAAQEQNFSSPATMALATKLAEGYNPVGMVTGPQSQALETARKNAVKMLGLPENNTAMDRAKALGFEDRWGHGSPRNDLTYLQPSRTGAQGPGAYATNYLPETGQYAMGKEGATSYPLMVRRSEALLTKQNNPYDEFGVKADDELLSELFGRGKTAMVTTQEATPEWLLRHGSPLMPERLHYVSVRPENFRSRFAAFDPARVNENDLLAGMIPLGALAGTDEVKEKANKMVEALRRKKPD